MRPIFTTFKTLGGYYLYDRNRNSILNIPQSHYVFLSSINTFSDFEHNEIIKIYQKNGFLLQDELKGIIHPDTYILEFKLNNCMYQLTLQITQECNLRCAYCIYSGEYNQRSHSKKSMTLEIAKKAINFLLEHSKNQKRVCLAFYGGEPLLEKDLLKECVKYAKDLFQQKDIHFTLTTNGTLLDDDIVEFFIEYDFSVMISLDGPKDIHDKNRKFASGNGTFDTIIKNVIHIKEKYPEFLSKVMFNIVLSPGTSLKCTNDFFNSLDVIQSEFVNKSYISDNYAKTKPAYDDLFMAESAYEKFKLYLWILKKISKENISKLFIQDFSRLVLNYEFMVPIGKLPQYCHPGGPCIPGARRAFVTIDGTIMPCERVSEMSDIMKIGNLDNGFDINKVTQILNIGKITENECKSCWCLIHCSACAAVADDYIQLSKEKKLQNCNKYKSAALDTMKTICFLKEQNNDLEDVFKSAII